MKNNRTLGITATTISALLFGFAPVLCNMAFDLGSNPTTLTAIRSLFAIPVLLIIIKFKHINMAIPKDKILTLIFIGIFCMMMTSILLYSAYASIGIGIATSLHFLYPIMVALLCRLFYKDSFTKGKVISLCLAFVSVIFFIGNDGIANIHGVLLAIASSITYAAYMVLMEKKHISKINPYVSSLYFAIIIGLGGLAYAYFTGTLILDVPPITYLYIFIVSICTSFLAVLLLQVGIRELGSSTASLFCLFEPISSLIAGIIFLHEQLTIYKVLGCLFIILALLCLVLYKEKKK